MPQRTWLGGLVPISMVNGYLEDGEVTSTHGAFGALAIGIGTSEVEHVLATQCLQQQKPKAMRVRVDGKLPEGVTAKDLALAIIGKIGTDGGAGHVIEYAGEAVRALSMEGRMTLCNLSIESGARAGMVAPDETTFAFVKGREAAPKGAGWDKAVAYWRTLATDEGARFDKEVSLNASELTPYVTWGTNPGMVSPITGRVPNPQDAASEAERSALERALSYMALKPGTRLTDIAIDRVFIGSCTNATPGRSSCRRPRSARLQDSSEGSRHDRSRIAGGEGRRRAGRAASHLFGSGSGVARIGLLDVSGDESRYFAAGPALRRHQQPQLRRTPGQGWPHAPRQSRPWPPPPLSRDISPTFAPGNSRIRNK